MQDTSPAIENRIMAHRALMQAQEEYERNETEENYHGRWVAARDYAAACRIVREAQNKTL